MKKYLVVKFKNAGLFPYAGKSFVSLDKSKKPTEPDARKRRFEHVKFTEPIAPNHIINMIHVLFGQRPKPSFRKVSEALKHVEYYVEKANESFLKIDSFKYKGKDGDERFVEEVMSLKKDTFDSWNPNTVVTFDRVKKLMIDLDKDDSYEVLNYFLDCLNKTFKIKNIDSLPLDTVKQMILDLKVENPKLYKSNIETLFQFLKSKQKMAFENYILLNRKDIDMNQRTALFVQKYVNKVIRLSGTIIVPVTDEDIAHLRTCSGYATILDGGLISIEKIIPENVLNTSDYTKVSKLSTKTVPYLKETQSNEN